MGLAVWGVVGVFVWATFPYKPTRYLAEPPLHPTAAAQTDRAWSITAAVDVVTPFPWVDWAGNQVRR